MDKLIVGTGIVIESADFVVFVIPKPRPNKAPRNDTATRPRTRPSMGGSGYTHGYDPEDE
jgi:hypothetical protein